MKCVLTCEEENKYKVGDYVYIEQSQSDPFVIRRIEELQKTAQGNVAAKVVCFYPIHLSPCKDVLCSQLHPKM